MRYKILALSYKQQGAILLISLIMLSVIAGIGVSALLQIFKTCKLYPAIYCSLSSYAEYFINQFILGADILACTA